jgi:hypothetical protein
MPKLKFISSINEFINESKVNSDFNSLPSDIKNILSYEYESHFLSSYDWNEKQDEFSGNREIFNTWLEDKTNREFTENIGNLISKTRQDLITLKKKERATKALEYFEELIKPTLGNDVLTKPLSLFAEIAIYNNHTIADLNNAFSKMNDIIDKQGNIDYSKVIPSGVFDGEDISLPGFERFVEDNPEYIGVFNDWKKLFDIEIEMVLKELNAFRDSTSYDRIYRLYKFLVEYKKKM